jgi:hypothetical protein
MPVSDPLPPRNDEGGSTPGVTQHVRRRWQVGLRTVFLLMAAIAVWLSYFVNLRYNAELEARIGAMVPLAHEVIVTDPSKIAVVRQDDEWINETRWEIHVPDGAFRLCLATRGIDENGLATIVKSSPISSGTHQLVLTEQRDRSPWRETVLCDGREVIAWATPYEPKSTRGSTSVAGFAQSKELSADEPVILLRRRFHQVDASGRTSTSPSPSDGVLLWIERTLEMGKQL